MTNQGIDNVCMLIQRAVQNGKEKRPTAHLDKQSVTRKMKSHPGDSSGVDDTLVD